VKWMLLSWRFSTFCSSNAYKTALKMA